LTDAIQPQYLPQSPLSVLEIATNRGVAMRAAVCCALLFLGWQGDTPSEYETKVTEAFTAFQDEVEEIRVATETTDPDRLIPVLMPRRSLWRSKDNFYERLSNGYWIEQSPKEEALIYREGISTPEYRELVSGDSVVFTIIRLYEDRADVRQSEKGPKFKTFYRGGWER
jgi:hypothetical protein